MKASKLPASILLAMAVVVPAVLWGVAAWLDYQATVARAREYVQTTTNALAEQTREALQTADLLLGRMLDHVNGMDWQTIEQSREVHDFLASLAHGLPQVQSVFFVDPKGFNSASSRAFPMGQFDDRQRDYYRAALDGNDGLLVAPAFLGQMTGRPGFTVSRPRMSGGRFDGVAVVTFSPDYFAAFYRTIALDPTASAAALVRTDGGLLARYPASANQVEALPPTSPLLRAAASGADAGVYLGTSSIDGVVRLSAFRRISGQKLLASFSLARSVYLVQWYHRLAWMAGFAALTSIAFSLAIRIVLRRNEAEEQALRLLLAESEGRKAAETRVQHLEKMEALGRISGGVAHDFNNLLAAILGSLELALRRLDEPERVRRFIDTAMQAAHRGARLTGQMLAFARNQDIEPKLIDVNQTIRDCEDLLQRTVQTSIQVAYDLDEALWPAIADQVQLEVALLNLAGNARDAMPHGGRLVVATRNETVDAAQGTRLSPGAYVRISVTDSGEGMNEAVLARAFDPFYTTKSVGKGTGLGLSQVYGFAEQLGGAAGIVSTPGEGTTVTIWLPRAEVGVTHQEGAGCDEPETSPAAPAEFRIMLVDDDAAVRSLAAEMLSDLGYHVVEVESGTAALALLRGDAAFDLLLVDYAMPGMTGVELAAASIALRPDLPVVFMTGYAETDVLNPWLSRGCGMIAKPFSLADLGRGIRDALQSVNARLTGPGRRGESGVVTYSSD
jgi:signal transduction histidine kinase/ActR/RegA family two-component response regulator